MYLNQFKSGKLVKRYNYSSFEPEFINHTWLWDDAEINLLLEKANKNLGELDAFSYIIKDVDVFIKMHITKEATQSSKIEGTKTEIDEALLPINEIISEKRDDWQEVQNYIEAINFSIKELDKLPLSNRLMRETHRILMQGARGEHKAPGEFRQSQNWIGGASLADAIFIPPHVENLKELISDLEKFLYNDDIQVPHLVKCAIMHYQFETIHPFLDGNGRIGRLLITLYLVDKKILKVPSLYLSDYFEKNRALYYDFLTLARVKNDLSGWIKFFLKAIVSTSEKSVNTFKNILLLKEKINKEIIMFGKRANKIDNIIIQFYKTPISNIKDLSIATEIDERTCRRLVSDLTKAKIINKFDDSQRNQNYVFTEYLRIFE